MGFVQSPQADSDWRGVIDPGKIAFVGMWEREIAQAPQQSSLQLFSRSDSTVCPNKALFFYKPLSLFGCPGWLVAKILFTGPIRGYLGF